MSDDTALCDFPAADRQAEPNAVRLAYLAMDPNLTAIERAFQAAKSGEAASMEDIRRLLKGEGYDVEFIRGPSIRRQLEGLMKETRQPRPPQT